MEYEKLMKVREEHVAIENVKGRRFSNFTPSTGEEVVGRVDGKLYIWGWLINDPKEDWTGTGSLGVRIDVDAFLLRRELIFLDGYGEWLPEEENNG